MKKRMAGFLIGEDELSFIARVRDKYPELCIYRRAPGRNGLVLVLNLSSEPGYFFYLSPRPGLQEYVFFYRSEILRGDLQTGHVTIDYDPAADLEFSEFVKFVFSAYRKSGKAALDSSNEITGQLISTNIRSIAVGPEAYKWASEGRKMRWDNTNLIYHLSEKEHQ